MIGLPRISTFSIERFECHGCCHRVALNRRTSPMENPGEEVADVVRALVKKPTFKQQADVIRQYFTPDATFFHVYVNVYKGHAPVTAIYQYGMFVANYQDVIIRSVIYDAKVNCVGVRMTVICKPWLLLWRSLNLELFTHLELNDSQDVKSGKTIKRIKTQKDYFLRDPLIQLIPIVGPLYDSDSVKFVLGGILTQAFRTVQSAYFMVVPKSVQSCAFSFWEKFLLAPPMEQFQSFITKMP
ncbi:hypothetical protein Mapa_017318 [Marchantia paleacea]|nr:hypothetical protein Mapa_017318 [Marchantia paleacea]